MKDLIIEAIELLEVMADDYEEHLPQFPNRLKHARKLAEVLRKKLREEF